MIFTNPQIDLSQLPRVATLSYENLERNYLVASIIRTLIFFVIVGGVMLFLNLNPEVELPRYVPLAMAIGWPSLLGFFLWLAWRGYQIEGFAVREKDLLHKKGVIFRKETAIPFKRVQHCEIQQGPIQRALNLSTLQIFTAGGSSSDLSISGLHPDTAQRLKVFLLQQTSMTNDGSEEE